MGGAEIYLSIGCGSTKGYLKKTNGEHPSFNVFKTIKSDNLDTIGHVQLMNIDVNNSNFILGRVLVFRKYRGTGLALEMVNCAVGSHVLPGKPTVIGHTFQFRSWNRKRRCPNDY
jgi:hypothetical protein